MLGQVRLVLVRWWWTGFDLLNRQRNNANSELFESLLKHSSTRENSCVSR